MYTEGKNTQQVIYLLLSIILGFSGGTSGKAFACRCGRHKSDLMRDTEHVCALIHVPQSRWACALEPRSHNYWDHTLQLMKTTCPRAQALQREKLPRWEACSAQLERSPRSVQLEESLRSHEDPEQPKINKLTNKENQSNNSWWAKY